MGMGFAPIWPTNVYTGPSEFLLFAIRYLNFHFKRCVYTGHAVAMMLILVLVPASLVLVLVLVLVGLVLVLVLVLACLVVVLVLVLVGLVLVLACSVLANTTAR